MPNIILLGFMGSGKSTLGKKLARKLNVQFIDSDLEIEKMENLSIPEIFATKGEDYFRDLEHKFVLDLGKYDQFVLSTGGGLPCHQGHMEILNRLGTTFYLKLNPFELTRRLLNAKTPRPLIMGKTEEEIYDYVKNKVKERVVFYQAATYILSGKHQNVKHILDLLGD